MKISGVIKELQKIKKTLGDMDVEIQYRDEGGDYFGSDSIIYFYEKEDKGRKYITL